MKKTEPESKIRFFMANFHESFSLLLEKNFFKRVIQSKQQPFILLLIYQRTKVVSLIDFRRKSFC
jgi:hypothetical protein